MAPRTVPWSGAEARLLGEYLATRWPGYRSRQHVRVGPLPDALDTTDLTPEQMRAVGVWRRTADALVWTDGGLLLIEAMVRPVPGKLSQLQLYKRLLVHTAEIPEARTLPIEARLVSALDDPTLRQLAVESGITFELYTPVWVAHYLMGLAPRARTASLPQLPREIV